MEENADRFAVRALTSSASGGILKGSLARPSVVEIEEDKTAATSSGQALGSRRDKTLHKVKKTDEREFGVDGQVRGPWLG